jgi:hypothetical protein
MPAADGEVLDERTIVFIKGSPMRQTNDAVTLMRNGRDAAECLENAGNVQFVGL